MREILSYINSIVYIVDPYIMLLLGVFIGIIFELVADKIVEKIFE